VVDRPDHDLVRGQFEPEDFEESPRDVLR
jgi:hypothetical protein